MTRRWLPLLAAAAASAGCLEAPVNGNALAIVTIDHKAVTPPPQKLLFSWLRCGKYLVDRQRVPAKGSLTGGPASVHIAMKLASAEIRAVVVEAIAGDQLVARAVGEINVKPLRTTKLALRMSEFAGTDMTTDPPNDCASNASGMQQEATLEAFPDLDSDSPEPHEDLTER